MAGIRDVGSLNNLNVKKVPGKLSFDVGEVFSAKVLKMDVGNSEVVLKLIDGWQFNAKMLKQLDSLPEGLVKFQVEGFEDGKLNIRLVKDKNDENAKRSTIEDILSGEDIDFKEEDYNLLNSMIKHNMPLTKENISKIKTLVQFKNKFSLEEGEKEKFISSYLDSKEIDISSEKGKNIEKMLKNIFKELENINEDDILTLFENGIDITEENIKSYQNLFKDQSSIIYKDLMNIKEEIGNQNIENQVKVSDNLKENLKQQIMSRIEEMKLVIKEVLDKNIEEKNVSSNKILEMLNDKVNDFKVYNLVSNQYYYIDLPIKIKDYNYECKFMIKDDRKSGKKVDSKNVKLVLSVDTKNLGIVDAYIKVNDDKMTVDLKCDEKWTSIFSAEKYQIFNELSAIGFDVNVNVVKRDKEVSLANCRDFFNDVVKSNIDVMV